MPVKDWVWICLQMRWKWQSKMRRRFWMRRTQIGFIFLQSDLFDKVVGKFEIIVSNPPYIASAEVEKLMPEVRDHEPRMALDGTEDGLHFYRRIIEEAGKHLVSSGMLFFEIGYDQGQAVSELMRTEQLLHFRTGDIRRIRHNDLEFSLHLVKQVTL